MIDFFPSRRVAVELFSFSIHWYGLMYLLGFFLAYVFIYRLQDKRELKLSKDDVASLLTWSALGVIIGGRLGYVLFYEFSYFLKYPVEILFVWNGGMSSHGGFLGVAIALWIGLKRHKISIFAFLDIITVPVALALALGRFGNFINLELYGMVTDVPWAVQIPGVEGLRHPTFFYAIAKNLFIALACFILLQRTHLKSGSVFGVFLILYGVLRYVVEFFRDQSYSVVEIGSLSITRGQLLSIPIIMTGLLVLMYSRRSL